MIVQLSNSKNSETSDKPHKKDLLIITKILIAPLVQALLGDLDSIGDFRRNVANLNTANVKVVLNIFRAIFILSSFFVLKWSPFFSN